MGSLFFLTVKLWKEIHANIALNYSDDDDDDDDMDEDEEEEKPPAKKVSLFKKKKAQFLQTVPKYRACIYWFAFCQEVADLLAMKVCD